MLKLTFSGSTLCPYLLPFQLIKQPIANKTIELVYNNSRAPTSFDAFLYDSSGKQWQDWKNVSMNPNEAMEFKLSTVSSGVYWFTIRSEKNTWSNQIVIID